MGLFGIFLGIFPRGGAILTALILIAVSAATIGVINNNDGLVALRDYDGPIELSDDLQELQGLILLTQAAAGWIIFMSIGLVLAEIIALVFVIVDLQSTAKLVLGVLEIIFSGLVILVLLATGIACASYAAAWGQPPDACEPSLDEGDDLCDSVPLTAVTALATVFSFIQIGVFGMIIIVTILGIMKSSNSRPTIATEKIAL